MPKRLLIAVRLCGIVPDFGKYELEQSEKNRLDQGGSGITYRGRGPKVTDVLAVLGPCM